MHLKNILVATSRGLEEDAFYNKMDYLTSNHDHGMKVTQIVVLYPLHHVT